jgi:hypothetical protein
MFSQVGDLWAHVDLNHGPRPYQGRALTGLSYGPHGDRECIAEAPSKTREVP